MRKIILLFICAAFIPNCFSQDSAVIEKSPEITIQPDDHEGFLGVHLVIPSAKMRPAVSNNMGDLGFGLAFQMLSDPATWSRREKYSCFRLGAGISYTYFGRYHTDVDFNRLKTTYGIFNLNAVFRLRPFNDRKILPYLELFTGLSTYFSSTKWTKGSIASDDDGFLGAVTNSSLNKGIAVGLNFSNAKNPGWSLRAGYQWAGDLRYVVRNSIVYQSPDKFNYREAYAPVQYFTLSVCAVL
jgi:hypothetical protein